MPSSDESPAIKTLKKQCQEGLDSARQMRSRPIENAQFTGYTIETANEAPIGRARAMQQELRLAEYFKSSAWALIYASNEYQKGVHAMINMPSYVQRSIKPTAISCLCSAVMYEQRGVTVILDDGWQSLYNRQMMFEMRANGAWPDAGAKKVLEEASKRLSTSAWDSVRPALDVTVNAFDVLLSGQDIWKDVSPADRGHIFDMTFVRGVKRIYMLALFEAFASGGKLNSAYKFEEILQLAHEIIAEVKANPPEPGNTYDPAFVCSFWDNTLGDAYSMLGYHNLETGQLPSMKAKKAQKHFMEAAKYYLQAAEAYPKDDERHVQFLSVAIQAYWRRGTPLRLTHLLSERMCEDKALAEGIWLTQLTTKVSWIIEKVVEFKEECDKAIAKGKMNLDDIVQPECMNSVEESPGAFSLYKGIYHWKWKVYKTR